MKLKTVITTIIIFVMAGVLIGCRKPVPEETILEIEDVLETATNNQEVIIEGVVYAKVATGFYVSDSDLGKIFVTDTTQVDVGDKVKIYGQFGIASNVPRIKNVTKVEETATGQTLPTPTQSTVSDILALSGTAKKGSYAKLVELVATVEETTTGYILRDDDANYVIVSSLSDTTALAAKVNTRVTLPVIVHEYNTLDLIWRVTFAGSASDMVNTPIDFNTLKERALTHINQVVPSEIYGAVVLPTVHPTISYLTYTWTVDTNDYVSINQDGLVEVVTDEADHAVTFQVTITDGTDTATETIAVTSKGIVERSVAQLYTNMPEVENSVVILRGVVVAFVRNQSLTIRSVIIKDMSGTDTISVDFADTGTNQILHTDAAYTGLKLGDEIVVRGTFRIATRQTVHTVTDLTVASSGNLVTHDKEHAYVLNDQASYAELGNNFDQYSSRLVKFEDPFMNYSTSTPPLVTNWVRLGYSAETANAKHDGAHNYAFLIAANNESLGSEKWHKMFDIPLVGGPAQQFGGSFYAYVMYMSETYIAFVVPSDDCWEYTNQASVEYDLGAGIPASLEEGSVILPTTHPSVTGDVVWSSSDETLISSTTGAVTGVDVNAVVTLTAVYTYEAVQYTSTYEVTILGTQAWTVSQLLADGEDAERVKVKGIFVSYQSDGNANAARDGIILLDEETGELLLVNAMAQVGGVWGAYIDSDGNALEFGHEVQITGVYYLNSLAIGSGPAQTGRKFLEVGSNSVIKRLSETKKTIDWKTNQAIVVDDNDDLLAFGEEIPFGQLIKFVGTAESPIYLGGSTSTSYDPINIKVFKTAAVDNTGTKYNGQTFSLKNNVNTVNAGATWLKDLFGIESAFVGPSETNPAKPYIGSIYVVIAARTSTYYQMSLVNYDAADITKVYTEQEVNNDLVAELPATAEAGTFTASLPTTHPAITGSVVWTSLNPDLINLSTNTVASVDENTQVTLEGRYTLYGTEYVVSHVILVQADQSGPMSVSVLLRDGVENLTGEVKGYVAGYQSDGNSNVDRDGILLMDKTTGELLLVQGLGLINSGTFGDYKDNSSNDIEVGHEVIISGVFHVDSPAIGSGPAQPGRKYLQVTTESVITRVSDVIQTLPWDKEGAVIVDEDADLVAFAANPEFGKLIEITGTAANPIQVGGSSSTYATMNVKIFMNNATINDETKYSGQTFALKNNINEANQAGWLNTLFGIDAGLIAPSTTVYPKNYTGTLYVVLAARTSTYFQLALVNFGEASATSIPLEREVSDELKANIPATVEAGPIAFTLPTTHEDITGSVVWTSLSPSIVDLTANTVASVAENTQVTLEGRYTLNGIERVATHVMLVQASVTGPLSVSSLVTSGVEGMEAQVVGYVAGHHGDGNSAPENYGIILMDKTNGELLLTHALNLVNEGTYGAYKDDSSNLLEIGHEVIINGIFHVDATTGKKSLEITATSSIERVSETKNTLPWDTEGAILIDEDADLVAFSANPQYGKLVKMVGTATNPIQVGGSSTTYATMNIKLFMNDAVDNDGTKYNGQTFALKNSVNEANQTGWLNTLFGIDAGFVGPKVDPLVPPIDYTGTVYFVLSYRTSTYFQLALVNFAACSATPLVG